MNIAYTISGRTWSPHGAAAKVQKPSLVDDGRTLKRRLISFSGLLYLSLQWMTDGSAMRRGWLLSKDAAPAERLNEARDYYP